VPVVVVGAEVYRAYREDGFYLGSRAAAVALKGHVIPLVIVVISSLNRASEMLQSPQNAHAYWWMSSSGLSTDCQT